MLGTAVPLPEIRLQLAAVTLVEELNFTRAAEHLRTTQPALSKQISIGLRAKRHDPIGPQSWRRSILDGVSLVRRSSMPSYHVSSMAKWQKSTVLINK